MGAHNSKARKSKCHLPQAAWKVTFSKFAVMHQESGQMAVDHSTFEKKLLAHLPTKLCEVLWQSACGKENVSSPLTENMYGSFVQHIEELCSETQVTQFYLQLWQKSVARTTLEKSDIVEFFRFCAFQIFTHDAMKSTANSSDDVFESVIAGMSADKNGFYPIEEVISWIVRHAPNLASDINTAVRAALVLGKSAVLILQASFKEALHVGNIPLPTFWLLAASLPEIYKSNDIHQDELLLNRFDLEKLNHCHLLYDSVSEGLSGSRFRSRVVDYLGPTLFFVWFSSCSGDSCYCLAHDSGWKEGWKPHGSYQSRVYQVQPQFRVMLSGSDLFYSNFSTVSGRRGIFAGRNPVHSPLLYLDEGLYTAELYGVAGRVERIVVMGCGNSDVIAKQLAEKERDRRLAVQSKDRKLRVNMEDWQDSVDRQILSLGGVNVRNADLIGGRDQERPDDSCQ